MILISITILVCVAVLVVVGRYFIYTKIQKSIEEQLANLKYKGINIDYDYLNVNILTGKIEFYQLEATIGKDSIPTLNCQVPHFLVRGIKILPFLRDKSLVIDYITFQNATIRYTPQKENLLSDSSSNKMVLQNVTIGTIALPEVNCILMDSVKRDTILELAGTITLQSLDLERQIDSLTSRQGKIKISDVTVTIPKEHYAAKVKLASLDVAEKTLTIDSMDIRPTLDKHKFMQVVGKEIDHIAAVVPYIRVRDINWLTYPDRALEIAKIDLQFFARIFRDKRYPFIKNHTTVLPSHFIQKLPIKLSIDSIQLTNSYVSYEEFPEEGDSTGIVVFDRLFATITSLHNNPKIEQPAKMVAYSKFMGAGDLNVNFSFPYNVSKPYYVNGSLKNMPLVRLNRMLGAAAKVKIESGIMTNLEFNFSYDMLKSNGEVELNYEDLRILSLRENKREKKQAISLIKTLLLNTLIIKKDMNEDMERDRRTGTIEFYRDTKRSVFNYWWKSVLSGIKSAYKIDKLPIKKKSEKKNEKKKQKDTKT